MKNTEERNSELTEEKNSELTATGLQIVATGRALPEWKVSNEELSRGLETDDAWIRSRTGIRNRYRCAEETCFSLAAKAGRQAMERAGISPEEIGAVIVATSTGDTIFPSAACMVQKALGIGEETMAFDLSAACTGFMLGLSVARGLLRGMRKKYVLLIGSEQLSRLLDDPDRSTCILFGDGAGAAVLTLSDGAFFQKSWSRGQEDMLYCLGAGSASARLHMKGSDVYKFAVSEVGKAMDQVLSEAGMTMEDVDLVVCHQANERIIRHIERRYPGQEQKFFVNIGEYGNTSAASIPIALDELAEQGRLKRGMRILMAGFGAGLTWSAALMEL